MRTITRSCALVLSRGGRCADTIRQLTPLFRQIAAAGPLFAVLLLGCGSDLGEPLQSGRVLSWVGLQGRWVGTVVPTENACGPTTEGLMSIGKREFGFDPFQSTAVIRGELGDDGRLSGRLVRQGGDHSGLSLSFEGSAEGSEVIRGTLQSGRCRWTVVLHRG